MVVTVTDKIGVRGGVVISAQRLYVPQYCRVEGRDVAYVRSGTGEQGVLLVHGITSSSFIWEEVIPHLEADFDVVAVDLLGCGASDRTLPADYSLKAHAARLHTLVEHLGWRRLHLVGHDLGGGIAQIFAVDSPHRLYSLALVNSVGYDFWPVQPIVAMRTPILRHLAMATLDTGMLRLVIRRAVYHKNRLTPDLMERFHGEIAAPKARRPFLNFARCLNNGDLMEIADDLGQLQVPTLLVRGDEDVFLSEQICERLHRELPLCRMVRVASAGHFIQLDEPEFLAGRLADHFGQHSGE